MAHRIRVTLVAAITMLLAVTGTTAHASTVDEEPTALAMMGDALLARPALLAATVVGSAVYTVSLPFSAIGGNASEAGHTLVVEPSKATFVRCLGCTMSGRKTDPVVAEEDD